MVLIRKNISGVSHLNQIRKKILNVYFNKKLISYCIIFIEMVICVDVDCKNDGRQGKAHRNIKTQGITTVISLLY